MCACVNVLNRHLTCADRPFVRGWGQERSHRSHRSHTHTHLCCIVVHRPQVTGATVGIVGLGSIGLEVARRCRGFKMRVIYHNRSRRSAEDEAEVGIAGYCASLEELLRQADFVVLVSSSLIVHVHHHRYCHQWFHWLLPPLQPMATTTATTTITTSTTSTTSATSTIEIMADTTTVLSPSIFLHAGCSSHEIYNQLDGSKAVCSDEARCYSGQHCTRRRKSRYALLCI
jgi:predicted dinucleotide-binding enzyme